MAVPQGAGTRQARPGMTGGWFWLVASFAATLLAVYPREIASDVVEHLVGNAVSYGVPIVLWSLAGRILGALLRAAAPAPAPSWIFRYGGWTVATLGAGVLLALQAGDDPRFLRDLDAWYEALLFMALLGFAWWLLIDVGRVVLARIARRPPGPILSVASVAFACGLVAIAWTVYRHLESGHDDPPFEVGLIALTLVLGGGAIATLLIELPGAILVRRGLRDPLKGSLASVRGGLAGQVEARAVRAVGGVLPPRTPPAAAAHTRAREDHGRIVTPPTVVRRH